MKILKCHIENFGKLQNFDYEFNSSFNEIIEDNGWGKTTFSVFIKAMFYGMPATTKHKLNENERKKYNPWQGGNYGGNIEFEVDGEEYRLERFFGSKESEDTFSLIDLKTGKPSKKYSNNIGVELFDLDAEAYERSTYIPQKEIVTGINDKISSKLINMIQGTNNPESYENATNSIKERMTELKKRGNQGLIAESKSEMTRISEEIDSLKKSADDIDLFQKKVSNENECILDLEKSKDVISNQIKAYSKNQKIIANRNYISEMEQKIGELKTKIDKNMKILNGNKIDNEKLKTIQSKENINESNIKRLESLKEEKKKISKEISGLFENNKTNKEEIVSYIDKVNESNKLMGELNLLKQPKEIYTLPKKEKSNKPVLISFIIALFMLVLGVIFISLNKVIISVILFIMFVLCSGISGFIYFKNYIELKTSSPIIINKNNNEDEVNQKTEKLNLLDKSINEYISKFTSDIVNDRIKFLYDLKLNLEKYEYNLEKQKSNDEEIEKLTKTIDSLEKEINNYLNKFILDKELSKEEKFTQIKTTFITLENSEEELTKTVKSLSDFRKENSLEDENVVDVENVDIDKLQNQEKMLQAEIDRHREEKVKLTKNIDNIRNQLSVLDDYEEKLEEVETKTLELEEEYKILDLTNKYLEKANDNLSSKYLNPMKNSLNKYMKLLLKDKYQELNLDTNLNVSFETYGKSRELYYLSKGMQEVVDVCIRFSLIDVLFAKEKPFIILDDPFVNMDKYKIENAVKLIKDVSKTYQIIYLICHDSRK